MNPVELRRALVIPLRDGVPADLEIAVARLRDESICERYEQVVVVMVGVPDDRVDAVIKDFHKHLPSGRPNWHVYAPPGLRNHRAKADTKELITYLAETLPAKMGRESFALSAVLQASWPELDLACGFVLALRPEFQVVPPGGGDAHRPEIPAALLRRVGLLAVPTGVHYRERLIGSSPRMKALVATLEKFAQLPFPLLLEGETGVGKELCAGFIHEASGREGRFLAVNGALLDPGRAEDELFGHVSGAFTGAVGNRAGRIREAEKGTFFLDELLTVPSSIQPMLLRAFNNAMDGEIEVTPLGQEKSIRVDVRLITSMQPLDEATTSPLRDDLVFRVRGLHVVIPPLRDRGDDVLEIAEKALEQLYKRSNVGARGLGPGAHKLLRDYSWPGNVRELQGVMRMAWASNDTVTALAADHLRPFMPAMRTSRGTGLRAEVNALVLRRIDEARRLNPRGNNAAARSLGFEKGQAMTRYQAKCATDAAGGRRRKGTR